MLTDAERAAWLADKIVACGDYAKEAAAMLRRWPEAAAAKPTEDFDRWMQNPYTKVLMNSMDLDYMPRVDAERLIRAASLPPSPQPSPDGVKE